MATNHEQPSSKASSKQYGGALCGSFFLMESVISIKITNYGAMADMITPITQKVNY